MQLDAHLRLAEDVHVCVTQGHAIFLDLNRDAYSAIALASQDKTGERDHASSCNIADALQPFHKTLRRAGLLAGNEASPAPIFVAATAIKGHILGEFGGRAFGLRAHARASERLKFIDAIRFLRASYGAARDLKRRHIAKIVKSVRLRRTAVMSDPATVRRLVSIFCKLRPWYPRDYLCLYEALALVKFLALYGVHATWVFGVQAQPFGAHCWVEHEGLLLNESLEYAGQFTPIMRV